MPPFPTSELLTPTKKKMNFACFNRFWVTFVGANSGYFLAMPLRNYPKTSHRFLSGAGSVRSVAQKDEQGDHRRSCCFTPWQWYDLEYENALSSFILFRNHLPRWPRRGRPTSRSQSISESRNRAIAWVSVFTAKISWLSFSCAVISVSCVLK